jgi:hypothetical protein
MDCGFFKSEKLLMGIDRKFLLKETEDLARQVEGADEGYSSEPWQKKADLG